MSSLEQPTEQQLMHKTHSTLPHDGFWREQVIRIRRLRAACIAAAAVVVVAAAAAAAAAAMAAKMVEIPRRRLDGCQ